MNYPKRCTLKAVLWKTLILSVLRMARWMELGASRFPFLSSVTKSSGLIGT
jgi:hypothetical protein